jgi:penicillin-binding protein 1B
LLLGALELSPLEVTQAYSTLANGGFRAPLRTVRTVVDAEGRTLERYALAIEQVANTADVHTLNQALVQVMERGTGRTARQRLDTTLITAGKTGTSDGFRDSWFAGFSNDHLIVTWVGNDDNLATGLTGATGAARVWSGIMAELETHSYAAPLPTDLEPTWIDYVTGLATDASCPDAVALSLLSADIPPKASSCGSDRVRIGSRFRRFLRNALD